MQKLNKNQLVINWHILEECNFGCNYCYAHWPEKEGLEAWKKPENATRILNELYHMPAIVKGEWDNQPRLNFAGGEPMLLWKNGKGPLSRIIDEAERLGFALSVITNGSSLITDDGLRALAPRLQTFGISMDSANPETNRKIGRCSKNKGAQQEQVSSKRVAEIFRIAREFNPRIECKLNTVICAENWREDFHPVISEILPDRWKVFQMLPIADTKKIRDKQQPLVITNEQFEDFKSRHGDLRIMFPENNDEMTDSYVMVDPLGRFYQNEPAENDHRHIVSEQIHETGAKKAWQQICFNPIKFNRRYVIVAQ